MNPTDHASSGSASLDAADEVLAVRAAGGEGAAFDELMRRYQQPLMRFLTRRFGRLGEAEDVLQDSFLKAYRALDTYDPARPLRAWLFTITHRQAISQLRKIKTRRDALADLSAEAAAVASSGQACRSGSSRVTESSHVTGSSRSARQSGSPPTSATNVAGSGKFIQSARGGMSSEPAPDAALVRRESAERLWAVARRALSDEQFSVLWMHYVDEISAPEIARGLGRSWVSVKTMLHRARKRIEPLLAEQADRLLDFEPAIGGKTT